MKKVELLAPAGGVGALKAAVMSGADAVYLGADRFSARKGADNFTLSELSGWIDFCKLRNTKVHLAANTLIKERETADFLEYIKEAYKAGIDALIVQDIGMAQAVKQLIPELPLHASTQMTVSSAEGVNELCKMGYERVVLARELTLDEIKKIRANTDAELEVFVHGALCFCYSGQCLMSSIIGQRSGNRGMCAQPCRLPYELVKNNKTVKSGYLMSPKDLCLLDDVCEMAKIGIDSFKIEGRLKGAEYVASAVRAFRKVLDGQVLTDDDLSSLKNAFNRSGFTKGWFGGAKDMMSGKSPSNVADGKVSREVLEYTKDNANFRKRSVNIFAELKKDTPLSVTMIDESGECATAVGEIPAQTAIQSPLTEERLIAQLKKLGAEVFEADSCEVSIDDGVTIPISEINAVRRKVSAELSKLIVKRERREIEIPRFDYHKKTEKEVYLTAVCSKPEQAITCLESGIERVAVPVEMLEKTKINDERIISLMPGVGAGCKAPTDAVMVMNIAQIEKNRGKKLYGGFRLNVTNSFSEEVFKDFETVTLSPELNLKDIKEMKDIGECEVIAYGKLPLMIMRNCPAKAAGICKGEGGYSLKDRRGEIFDIMCHKGCISELNNAKPIYMADKVGDLINSGVSCLQLWFTDESCDEIKRIIDNYKDGIKGVIKESHTDFTRGHFYRGMV